MNLNCITMLNRFCVRGLPRHLFHVKQLNPPSRGISGAIHNKLWQPSVDLEYLKDPRNEEEIAHNINSRKSHGCLKTFNSTLSEYDRATDGAKPVLWEKLISAGLKIPNKSDPRLIAYGDAPHVAELVGQKPSWSFPPREFHDIAKNLDLLRIENLGNLTGHRSYYFLKELAQLEQALIHYAVDSLVKKGFTLYSVPDLLRSSLIQGCGMDTHSERTQVYRLEPKFYDDICLSGTAEMALASFHSGRTVPLKELPIRMAAVSRCYRAETSNVQEERGIYRVHQFTKVEMFGLTRGDVPASHGLLEEFVGIQKELFTQLGFHYQLLDMPVCELGDPAYRKFDVEAWMPGRGMYGEVSSASNCTDYQSRRLGIRTTDGEFVHTVNGTACAVPRTLITLLETHQEPNGDVNIPQVLQPYFKGRKRLSKTDSTTTTPFKLRWIKFKSQQGNIH